MAELGDARTWLGVAREDLAIAEARIPGVGYGLLCFHAQQAAEKAIKAVLLGLDVSFPFIHDLGRLLEIADAANLPVPTALADADLLTDYATLARYPSAAEIDVDDYVQAIAMARAVVSWAEGLLEAAK